LSVLEAAARLGVSDQTVLDWIHKGRIQGLRVGRRVWAIPEAEVERVGAQGRPRPGPKKGQPLARRYSGVCQACGQAFTSARPARFCSPRCSARFRARERKARRP
jgi:excisionase family DNA binding protein